MTVARSTTRGARGQVYRGHPHRRRAGRSRGTGRGSHARGSAHHGFQSRYRARGSCDRSGGPEAGAQQRHWHQASCREGTQSGLAHAAREPVAPAPFSFDHRERVEDIGGSSASVSRRCCRLRSSSSVAPSSPIAMMISSSRISSDAPARPRPQRQGPSTEVGRCTPPGRRARRFEDVRPAANSAVDDHLGAAADRFDDLRQRFVIRPHVELSPAVVRDVDRARRPPDRQGASSLSRYPSR